MPVITEDESLSSWAHRANLDVQLYLQSRERISSRLFYGDPDFDSTPDLKTFLASREEIISTNAFDSSTMWTIPHGVADFVCELCLRDSLKNHHALIFKKSWRYVMNPICNSHGSLLSTFPPRSTDRMQYLSNLPRSMRTRLQHKALEIIVSTAHQQQIRLNSSAPTITSFAMTTNRKAEVFKFIAQLFLHSGDQTGGIASFFLTSPRHRNRHRQAMGWRLLFISGAVESSSLERACALIMLGIVSGDIGEEEIDTLTAVLTSHDYYESLAPYDLGRLSKFMLPEHATSITNRLNEYVSVMKCDAYLKFLRGFEL